MNLRKFNISSLMALAAIVEEGNVSRAARSLSMSQSALSTTLNQLRHYFQDELFIRSQRYMIPTSLTKQIYPEIKRILNSLESLLVKEAKFDPKKSSRVFTLAMPDFRASVLLPRIMKRLVDLESPIRINIKHAASFKNPDWFIAEGIDLAINQAENRVQHMRQEHLLDDWPVIIGHRENPLFAKPITKRLLYQAKQIQFSKDNFVESYLAPTFSHNLKKLEQNVMVKCDTILPILYYIQHNKACIAIFLHNIAHLLEKSFSLAIQPLPLPVIKMPITFMWHEKDDNNEGLLWLRETIREVMI